MNHQLDEDVISVRCEICNEEFYLTLRQEARHAREGGGPVFCSDRCEEMFASVQQAYGESAL